MPVGLIPVVTYGVLFFLGHYGRSCCFWFDREFLSFQKWETLSFGFSSTMCTFCTKCAFYYFCFYFSKHQNIFDGFANVFIKGEIVKSNVFLIIILWWTIGIGDYWFWYLEFIYEVVLEMIGFYRYCAGLGPVRPGMCCRSDQRVSRGQTGAARGLTGRLCVGFGFGLFV